MSKLSVAHKTFLEAVLDMKAGTVLDFTNNGFTQFFDALGVEIYDEQYAEYGPSKANRLRSFWKSGSDSEVAGALGALADYLDAKSLVGELREDLTVEQIAEIRKIARDLAGGTEPTSSGVESVPITSEATVSQGRISIEIHEDIYGHVGQFLARDDYFQAVEEAYKVVREKLRELTRLEKATDVFNQASTGKAHYEALFGKTDAANDGEADFFRGVGYLHLGVQFLRNEKAHALAAPLEQNLALHYISLASLAYDLITQYVNEETIHEIEEFVERIRSRYSTAEFYPVLKNGQWIETPGLPNALRSAAVRKALKGKWLVDADFTRSYNHSNIILMRLELVVDQLTMEDIDTLLDLPTIGVFGNSQMAGLEQFLYFVDSKDPRKISVNARKRMLT